MEDRRSLGEIAGMALELYGQRFGTFFAVSLVGQWLWVLGGAFLGEVSLREGSLTQNAALVGAGVLAMLLGVVPRAIQVPALLSALNETYLGSPATIGRAFERASARLTWETAWVNLISFWLTLGGLVAGILPGIVFGIWFCLADVAVVLEGERDLRALKRSQRLVRGETGKAFVLIVLGILASVVPGAVVRSALPGVPGGIMAGLMGVFATPFQYALHLLLFHDLRARRGGGSEEEAAGPPSAPGEAP